VTQGVDREQTDESCRDNLQRDRAGGRRDRRVSGSTPRDKQRAFERATKTPGTQFAPSIVLEAIMIRLKTILVPTDFSECSDAAVKYGYALAEAFGATLHLLNVVQHPYSMPWAADGFTPIGDLLADWEAQAKRRLVESVPATAPAKTVVKIQVGSPHPEIVRYAAQYEIDLIVLGTHGRGPLGHMLLGSVAERVVRTAPCPVLTVRHPQHEFVADAAVAQAVDASRVVTAG
jgi:nucleotide-binding universal stress UspA family protein